MILAILAAATANLTVADLKAICTSEAEGDKTACRYFIAGVVEGMEMGQTAGKDGSKLSAICVPDAVPFAAFEFKVKTAMGQDLMFYPDDAKLDAGPFVGAIIGVDYACKK